MYEIIHMNSLDLKLIVGVTVYGMAIGDLLRLQFHIMFKESPYNPPNSEPTHMYAPYMVGLPFPLSIPPVIDPVSCAITMVVAGFLSISTKQDCGRESSPASRFLGSHSTDILTKTCIKATP